MTLSLYDKVCMSWRFCSSGEEVTIKLKWIWVGGRAYEYLRESSLCISVYIMPFPAVSQKVSRFRISMTLTEQECTFCIWLKKKHSLLQCVCAIPRWWWMHASALCDNWGSIHGCLTEETGEQESVWVCGYVSLTSIALFHQRELDLTIWAQY